MHGEDWPGDMRSLNKKEPLGASIRGMLIELARDILAFERGSYLGVDPENLHHMRGSIKRLRAALTLLGDHTRVKSRLVLIRRLTWFGDEAGPTRDSDVMLQMSLQSMPDSLSPDERPGMEALQRLIMKDKEERMGRLRQVFDSKQWKELKQDLQRLAVNSPEAWLKKGSKKNLTPRTLFRSAIRPPLAVLEARAEVLTQSANAETLHRFRVSQKRVRYVLEYFKQHLKKDQRTLLVTLKDIQDCLGEIHDLDVLEDRCEGARLQMLARPVEEASHIAAGLAVQTRRCRTRKRGLMDHFHKIWQHIHQPGEALDQLRVLANSKSKQF